MRPHLPSHAAAVCTPCLPAAAPMRPQPGGNSEDGGYGIPDDLDSDDTMLLLLLLCAPPPSPPPPPQEEDSEDDGYGVPDDLDSDDSDYGLPGAMAATALAKKAKNRPDSQVMHWWK